VAEWLEVLRAQGPARVATAWGLVPGRNATGGRSTWACPACSAPTRHTRTGDKRGAVGLTPDGQGWRCHQCDASGDAVALAAWLALGRGRWSGADALTLRAECAARGLCEGATGAPLPSTPPRPLPPLPPVVAPPVVRPPASEVAELWSACEGLGAMPAWQGGPDWCGTVREYLASRRFDVGTLAGLNVARILPPPERHAYPAWWPAAWADAWRLVVPAYEASGALASLHARAVRDVGEGPKTRWPRGAGAAGLLLACPLGAAFLRGEGPVPSTVLVVEGLADTLAAALMLAQAGRRWPVLGVSSGSTRAVGAVRWPRGVICRVATDPDGTGEQYAAQVRAALPAWVPFARVELPGAYNVQTSRSLGVEGVEE